MRSIFIVAALSLHQLGVGTVGPTIAAGPPSVMPEAQAPLPNTNGMDRRGIWPDREWSEVDGQPVSVKEAWAALRGDDAIVDDANAPSLTLIGDEGDVGRALSVLKEDQALADLARSFLLQTYRPDHPMVKKSGFVVDGKPTIYAQMPDGRVLMRLAGVPEAAELHNALVRAAETASGVRQPTPNYQPVNDPGLVIKPQVDATVAPPPWIYILTHMGALLVGGLGALGGRWAVTAVILGPMLADLESRMAARMQSAATSPGAVASPGAKSVT